MQSDSKSPRSPHGTVAGLSKQRLIRHAASCGQRRECNLRLNMTNIPSYLHYVEDSSSVFREAAGWNGHCTGYGLARLLEVNGHLGARASYKGYALRSPLDRYVVAIAIEWVKVEVEQWNTGGVICDELVDKSSNALSCSSSNTCK